MASTRYGVGGLYVGDTPPDETASFWVDTTTTPPTLKIQTAAGGTGGAPVAIAVAAAASAPAALHASSHEDGGTDEIDVTTLAGYPGGTTDFLRADGSFALPPAAVGSIPTGTVADYAGAIAPAGWLLCDGAAVSRVTYATLFTLIGETYGAGDGVTTFNVPNAKGRVVVGLDGGDTDFDALGETRGAKTVTSTGSVSAPTFTGDALGSHQHGAGTLATSAHSGTAVANHSSHTHTYSQVPNHIHGFTDLRGATTGGATTTRAVTEASDTSSTATGLKTANPDGGVAQGTTDGPGAALTHSVTQPDAHTMSGNTAGAGAGTPTGTISAPTYTGNATSVVQPSIVFNKIIKT